MKIKILILIFLIISLSGCTANYKLEINNKTIKERLTINNIDINEIKKVNIPIDYEIDDVSIYDKKSNDIDYYNIELTDNSAKISYNFNTEEFDSSMLFKNCYENATFTKDDYELLISTSNKFLCYDEYDELEEITINVYSKYKLINTNADKIDNNNYYWYINKSNKDSKKILLRLNTKIIKRTPFEIISESYYIMPAILIGIIIMTIIIISLIKKIGERRNKI